MVLQLEVEEITSDLFIGRWLGETQGSEMPAHIWEIRGNGRILQINTKWEGQARIVPFQAQLSHDEPAFFMLPDKKFKATLIDRQHFIIPAWCSNEMRGGEGPSYDVIFSRPGIAELTARAVYSRHQQEINAAPPSESPPQRGSDSQPDHPV